MIIVAEPTIKKMKFRTFGSKKNKTFEWEYAADNGKEKQVRQLQSILHRLTGNEKLEAVSFHLHFGGDYFNKPAKIDKNFPKKLINLADYFPLHIPPVCKLVELFYKELKNIPLYAFFETSLFSGLPAWEKLYPIANDYYKESGIMKRGFHGIFHGAHADMFDKKDRVISIVLDRHTTVCAIKERTPFTVSLGSTPLEGILSAKSCGDIDPGIIVYLMKEHGFSMYRIDDILKNESGFYGMTGYNLPPAELITLYGKDSKVALAFDVYKNQILKYIGDCIAIMGGFDKIVFAGQHVRQFTQIIYSLAKEIAFLEISLAELPWDTRKEFTRITAENSKRHIYINTMDETDIIYRETQKYLKAS